MTCKALATEAWKATIKLEKAEKYRRCNACHSEDTVYNVTVLDCWRQGVQITLCLDCLSKLVSLGQMVLHAEGKVQLFSIDEIEDSAENPLDISN